MSVLQKLEQVLDEERRLLLNGKISSLENISEIKIQLSEKFTLTPTRATDEILQRVSKKAKRNEELLNAAQRGIKSAMMHIGEASDGSFQSYSKEGLRSPLSKSRTLRQKI